MLLYLDIDSCLYKSSSGCSNFKFIATKRRWHRCFTNYQNFKNQKEDIQYYEHKQK